MTDVPNQPRKLSWLRVVATTIVCLAILGGAATAIVVINRTEPTAKQINATRKSAALVETITVERSTYRPRLVVLGTVEPAQDITLSPRVSGQIVELSPAFVPGGTVDEGDLLLRIDPADFENALSVSESELQQAEASLKIEEGRQTLAEKELALLEGTIDGANRALVLREPQIESIRAEVSAAEAAVERARLDLQRSSVKAPFDAQIISLSVNIGSQVSPGDELARLVGIKEYWIMATVPVRSLRWVQFPEFDGEGSSVTLHNPGIWPPNATRQGMVARMIGTLDRQTRLARVLITVPDPLAVETGCPPLILDTIVETHIECRPIEDVVRLSREYIRDQDTVWVLESGKLDIREVEIDFRDADHAYIREGLEDGDEVVMTTLATVAQGIGLKKIDGELPAEGTSNGAEDESADDVSAGLVPAGRQLTGYQYCAAPPPLPAEGWEGSNERSKFGGGLEVWAGCGARCVRCRAVPPPGHRSARPTSPSALPGRGGPGSPAKTHKLNTKPSGCASGRGKPGGKPPQAERSSEIRSTIFDNLVVSACLDPDEETAT